MSRVFVDAVLNGALSVFVGQQLIAVARQQVHILIDENC